MSDPRHRFDAAEPQPVDQPEASALEPGPAPYDPPTELHEPSGDGPEQWSESDAV